MHPLIQNLENFTENQLEQKIIELQRKYFSTPNPQLKDQIVLAIDSFKLALEEKRAQAKNNNKKLDDDLDKLININ